MKGTARGAMLIAAKGTAQEAEQLVSTDLILGSHQNQPRSGNGTGLGGSSADLQDANDRGIGRDHANSNRTHNRDAKNQRHKERNHRRPPFSSS